MTAARSTGHRVVVYGVTGQLGRELVERLEASDWPIDELVGVASAASLGREFEFRGEEQDVLPEAPPLTGRDLVFICTPRAAALEIVRDALRAEVACVDCSGALATQPAVPLLRGSATPQDADEVLAKAPVVAIASSTTLAWLPVLEALDAAGGLARLAATVLTSAGSWGRGGVAALSEESIALFNQSAPPPLGPAGRPIAFDVVPGGAVEAGRVRAELERLFGKALPLALSAVQVPTFVGEGALLSIELARPLAGDAIERALEARPELLVGEGASLRDALGEARVRVGAIEPDASGEAGRAWRLWLASDPLRLVADAAMRAAEARLGLGPA
ncbi:MAG: hypothetical protein R3F35_00805 [Myxococcota bacterium]